MELWIGRTPLLLQCNNCNGLNFAILAALFQAAEVYLRDDPYVRFAQMKEYSKPLNLSSAKRKQNLCIWWSFHCWAYLSFAFLLISISNPEWLPAPRSAQEVGMAPKPASWVTFPAVITIEKENSRGRRQYPKSSGGVTEEHTSVP